MSKIFDLKNIDKKELELEYMKDAAQDIKDGKLVIFPTETVYGIGANGLDEEATKSIFIAKGRAQDNPLILHVSNMEMVEKIAQNISKLEYKLMERFWPGPFTIILNRKEIVPNIVTGGLDTVGIRMPSNFIANQLISLSNTPIAAPSANISGRPSGTNVEDIINELKDKVDCIIDGGETEIGLESTVVRVIDGIPHILRPGKITAEQIKEVSNNVIIDKHILGEIQENQKVMSPGMKYRHYAPDAKCIMVYSRDDNKMIDKILELAKDYENPLIMCFREHKENFKKYKIIEVGSKINLDEISKNLFKDLRQVNFEKPDIVLIEGVDKDGIGLAIMNRLIRACDHNYIEL